MKCASAPWEHEAMANHIGYRHFSPADARTPSILKTRALPPPSGADAADPRSVEVTAYAFRAEDRVEQVPVWGNDGRRHMVPVHWTEYFPTSASRTISLRDAEGSSVPLFEAQKLVPTDPGWGSFFRSAGVASFFRHSIAASLR